MSVPERTSSGKFFGEHWRSGRRKCDYCGGEKELFVVTLDGFEKRPCHVCGGTGWMPLAHSRVVAVSSRTKAELLSRRRSVPKGT